MDEVAAKSLLMAVIGGYREPAQMMDMAAFVIGEAEITGLILGVLQPVYLVIDQPMVTDLIWYVDHENGSPTNGMRLLKRLHAWADSYGPDVKRYHTVNNYVGDLETLDNMMRRSGFELVGAAYEKEAGA